MDNIDWKSLIGYKTFDELRLTAFERWKSSGSRITNLNIGGFFRTLLELAIQGVADLFDLLLEVVPKGFLKYTSGIWLELKADERLLEKKAEQKAEGRVIFGRYNAAGNKVIPANSIIKTDVTPSGEELRYFVKESGVCPDGVTELAVPVIAEFAGAKYNVGQGAIKNMVNHVPGFDYVTNADSWLTTEGADVEDDDSLKERCRLRWAELAAGDPSMKYESWAMAIPGVVEVVVEDQHPRGPGTVNIIILSTSGTPTAELVNKVQTEINSKKLNCADVLVRGPLEYHFDVNMIIYLNPESSADPEYIQSQADFYTKAYFGEGIVPSVSRLKISQDFVQLDLASKIKNSNPAAIKNVKILFPEDDIAIPTGQIAKLQSLLITVERALEI